MKSIWYCGSVRYIGINTIIMKIHEITLLFEGYPQAQAAFIHQSGGDTTSVQKTIADFKQLVSRNQIKDVNQKNIDWWAKQGWDKFNVFVDQAAQIVPSRSGRHLLPRADSDDDGVAWRGHRSADGRRRAR